MRYSKGFSIVTVLGLTFIISLIGATAMYISLIDNKMTGAVSKYELADKSAELGLLQAVDSIQASGFCNNTTNNGTDGLATYTTTIQRSSNICFIRSTGRVGNAKVVKTAMIQSYYGIGLYTVRGNVNVSYEGGRLSGCDTADSCNVPAFIASGQINLNGANPSSCPADNGGQNIYGNPPIINGVKFIDLTPLFFNVDCENSIRDNCDYGLNNALEDTFSYDPNNNNLKDFYIDQYNQIVLSNTVENNFFNPPTPNQCPIDIFGNLNLANLTMSGSCYINQPGVNIYGTLPQGVQYTIYILGQNASNTILENVNGNTPDSNNNYDIPNYNLTIYTNTPIIISDGLFNTRLITDNTITYSYNGNVTLNFGVPYQTYINSNDGNPYTLIQNDIIIQGYDNSNEGNNIPQIYFGGDFQNQATNGNAATVDLYVDNSIMLVREIIFNTMWPIPAAGGNSFSMKSKHKHYDYFDNFLYAILGFPAFSHQQYKYSVNNNELLANASNPNDSSSVYYSDNYFANSLLYVYADSFPNNLPPSNNQQAINDCGNNYFQCGWTDNDGIGTETVYFGNDLNNNTTPSLLINNDTMLETGEIFLSGIYLGVGDDVLNYSDTSTFSGFLIRNLEPNLTFNINFDNYATFQFNKNDINALSTKFWFVQPVQCVIDNPQPYIQMIQTELTSY